MNNKTKRPVSIWISQILLIIFILLFLVASLISLINVFNSSATVPLNIFGIIVYFLIAFSLILLFFISFWGLAKRKTYGRWLGLTSLLLIWTFIILGQLFRPKGPLEYYQYDNNTQLVAGYITQIILHGLILFLILHVAFAKKVTAFFQPQIEDK